MGRKQNMGQGLGKNGHSGQTQAYVEVCCTVQPSFWIVFSLAALDSFKLCRHPTIVLQLITVPRARPKNFPFGTFFKELPIARPILNGFA